MLKEGLLHLKNPFFIKPSIFVLVSQESPIGHLEVMVVRTFKGLSRDVPGTSHDCWVHLQSLLQLYSTLVAKPLVSCMLF